MLFYKISINENNIIIGSENTLNKLDTDNVIIGNHNSYKDGGETYNDTVFVGNLNYIFGNDNRLKYLENENEKAKRAELTQNCRKGCTGCGINV